MDSVRLSSYYKRENKPAFGSLNTEVKEWQSRKNERAGRKPVAPLYTVKDSEETLKYVRPVM